MIRLHATQMIQMSNSSKPSGVDIWWDEFHGTFLCQSNRKKENVSLFFCRLSGALLKGKGEIMAKTLGRRLARKKERVISDVETSSSSTFLLKCMLALSIEASAMLM